MAVCNRWTRLLDWTGMWNDLLTFCTCAVYICHVPNLSTEVFRLVDYSDCEINRACAIAIDSAQLLQSINSRNSKTKMPIPYSLDLCWRVIWLHLAHHLNCKDISHQVSLSESTVYRYINAFEQTGDVAPRVSTQSWSSETTRRF